MLDSGIVIIGSGPSLCEEDIQAVKDLPCFSFNRSYLMFDKWNFMPRYYGCFDPLSVEDLSSEIRLRVINETDATLFINSSARSLYEEAHNKRINFVKLIRDADFICSTEILADLGSAGASAVQIAAGMGYKKVVLLGMDANYDLSSNQLYDNNHFDPQYSQGMRQRKYNDLSEMINGWEKVALGCTKHKIAVVNSSRESRLSCFTRSPINESIKWLQG